MLRERWLLFSDAEIDALVGALYARASLSLPPAEARAANDLLVEVRNEHRDRAHRLVVGAPKRQPGEALAAAIRASTPKL